MARTLTAGALSKIAQQYGTEPINIVGVKWDGTNEVKYADKELTGISGRILQIGNLDEVITIDSGNNSAAISITLDDYDGNLKTIIDTRDIHKKNVTVYQYFAGMSLSDAFALFHGEISSPITWSEKERKLSFNVLSKIESQEVGFSPEEGQFSSVPSNLIGQVWPLAFGEVAHIPVVKSVEKLRGTTQTLIGVKDYTLPYKYWHLIERKTILESGYRYYCKAINYLLSIARYAHDIEQDYINCILREDPRKQEHEDLAKAIDTYDKTLDKLQQELEEAFLDEVTMDNVNQLIFDVQTDEEIDSVTKADLLADLEYYRDNTPLNNLYKERIKEVTRELEELDAMKKLLEIDTDNAEYAYKTIEQILTKLDKLVIEYNKCLKEIYKVTDAITEQSKMPQTQVLIIGGEKFPQGVLTRITIKDMVFLGTFNGNLFTVNQIQAKYYGVQIGARLGTQLDAFWIADPNIDIKGHYCIMAVVATVADPDYNPYFPLRWRVFQIEDQIGTKCTIRLVELKEKTAPKRKEANNIPVLHDLPNQTWDVLSIATEHTEGEIVRMLENAIEKFEKNKLNDLKQSLDKIVAAREEATFEDEVKSLDEAIYSNIHEYNDIASRLRFTQEVIDKAYAWISEHEFKELLKLENLHIREQYQDRELAEGVDTSTTRIFYLTGYDIRGAIYATSPSMLPSWFAFSPEGQELEQNSTIVTLPSGHRINANFLPDSSLWIGEPGSPVERTDNVSEKYIVSIIPGTIKAVYGRKGINGVKRLVPIPKAYYTKNESDTSYPPLTVVSVTFKKALSEYPGEDWDDDIFVSIVSSVGPNTVDIIEWILENYTNVTKDNTSFTAVKAKLANYPSNFVLLEKRDAIQLIQDIAWQARCSATVKNNVMYLKYLSDEPSSTNTVTENDIDKDSLNMEYTTTEDLVTKFIALWKPNSAAEKDNKLILRHNVNKYGVIKKEYKFFIYNIESLVLKSATFWLIRYANTWKKAKFSTALNKLSIETGDCILLDLAANPFANVDVKAIVEKAEYDSSNNTISLECWLPVRSGEMLPYDFAFPAGISVTKLYPTVEEIAAGNAGSGSMVPKNVAYHINPNENLVEQLEIRPKDYGSVYPSDEADVYPPSPLLLLNEADYITIKPTEYAMSDEFSLIEDGGKPKYETKLAVEPVIEKQPEVFMARIVELTGTNPVTYNVRTTENQIVEVEHSRNNTSLKTDATIMVVKDPNTNTYMTRDQDENDNKIIETTLTGIGGDYLSVSMGNQEIRIAKPYGLRTTTYNGRTISGVAYESQSAITRVGTQGDEEETQTIIPEYITGDKIYVGKLKNKLRVDGYEVEYIDLNLDARAWAKVHND